METTGDIQFQPQTWQHIARLQTHVLALDNTAQGRVRDALQVMLYAHQGQDGRRPGEDYAQHPVEVALHLVEELDARQPDLIMAALLHDTVEDQAGRLASLGQSALLPHASLRAQALHTLDARFGPRVAELVSTLTNPDFAVELAHCHEAERPMAKNLLYQQHVAAILDKDPEAFLIKMADLAQNALRLHEIPEGPQKAHFRRKYGPVLLQLQARLPKLVDPAHPLFPRRAELMAQVTAVYQRDYAPYNGD